MAVLVLADEVEVFCTAAASALVSVGGVRSGVLLGTVSETLLPPQAPSASTHSTAAHTASTGYRAGRTQAGARTPALTAVPYACRT